MTWDIAAGIIIGGGALGLIWFGVSLAGYAGQQKNTEGAEIGWLISLAAIGAAVWIVFFKAHL